MDDIVSGRKIAVYCIENDQDAINRGEPKYYGFNFVVKREETEYMKSFIMKTLEELNVPVIDIDVYGNISLPIVRMWTKERIVRAIKQDAEELIKKSQTKSK